jgi:hypothetical protein
MVLAVSAAMLAVGGYYLLARPAREKPKIN